VTLTVDEAMALTLERRRQWRLMAYEAHDGRPCPIYACGNCYRQRYTLVTPGAKLPDACPQCSEAMTVEPTIAPNWRAEVMFGEREP
jgi:hypothetical protein